MYSLIFPTRNGLTCGSHEFEEVIKCFEIENEVVFARRNSETKESREVKNEFEDESRNVRKRCSTALEDLYIKFKDFSLEKNLAGKNRGKTKPVNTNQMQRWNSSPNISNEKTKVLWVNKRWQPKRKDGNSRKFTVNHQEQTKRHRRPSYTLSNQWRTAISQTAKVSKLDLRADEGSHNNNKLLPRRSSGPEICTSFVKDSSTSGKYLRKRRFSLPVSQSYQTLPSIIQQNTRKSCVCDVDPSFRRFSK